MMTNQEKVAFSGLGMFGVLIVGLWRRNVPMILAGVVGVLIAACVVGGVTIWYDYQSRSSAAKAWTEYFNKGIKIDGLTGYGNEGVDQSPNVILVHGAHSSSFHRPALY